MQSKNIIFLFPAAFPSPTAYANRIGALARGLKEIGHRVEILIIYPGAREFAQKSNGDYCGVPFTLSTFKPYKSNRLSDKILNVIGGILKTGKFLFGNPKPDFVFLCSSKLHFVFPFFLISKFRGIKLIREKNEYPQYMLEERGNKLRNWLYFNCIYRAFDAFILINSNLLHLFKQQLPLKKYLIIPIIVETDRFSKAKIKTKNIITFVGNLFGEKDGVRILLQAFAAIHSRHNEIKLRLIGDILPVEKYDQLRETCNTLGITNKVEFSGRIDRDIIPEKLQESRLLVLARPDNTQAKGGFPTKLGEYLATGVPVLVTQTGDIGQYLFHSQNAFLAKPGDVSDFADKMDYVLSNKEEASAIGLKGQKLAHRDFSYIYQSKRLSHFLQGEL
jgi:glycosyltransferase involved in cell wall biosynthesis